MSIIDFTKPTILTAQQYGTKVTVELDHSDTSLDELFDAFQTLCIGLGYNYESWRNQIKSLAEDMIEEDTERLKESMNEWKNEEDDDTEDVKARWDWDYTEEDEERMDIIGQNGNDGLHYDSDGFESYQNLNDEDCEDCKPNKVLIDAKKQYEEQVKKTKKTTTKKKAVKKKKTK